MSLRLTANWVPGALIITMMMLSNAVFAQQIEEPVVCPNDNSILDMAYGQHTSGCAINIATDLHRFRLCADVGDDVRFKVESLGSFMDPKLVVRNPAGAIVAEQSCNDNCAFTLPYVVEDAGCHTLFMTDLNTLSTGPYSMQIERYAPANPADLVVSYDEAVSDSINPTTDTDFFQFYGVAGSDVRLTASALGNFMDPTIEIRRPDGTLIVDGAADAATCFDNCAFSVDFAPDATGWYSLAIYDLSTFATGDFNLSLWCISGPCDSDGDGTPDAAAPLLSYVTTVASEIESNVDADFYRINATVGTEVRLSAMALGNFMDPTFEVRDPNNVVVIDGDLDGASCLDNCAFTIDFSPSLDGIYSLLVRDRSRVATGSYHISMWCISGPCDSDADGIVDGNPRVSYGTPAVLAYGTVATDQIVPGIDADIFLFGGTENDLISIGVTSFGNFMDPTVEIRDPNNMLVVDGEADGASCVDNCSFTLEFTPEITGTYSLLIRDRTGTTAGGYTVAVGCILGSCTNAVAICGDNCIDKPNGPLAPDDGGNIQFDADGDGQGNLCDADFNQSGVVNFPDIAEWSDFFLTGNPLYDIDGDGAVNFGDLVLIAEQFLMPPGPSCSSPIEPGLED